MFVACVVSSSILVCRRRRILNLLPLGEAFASDCSWTCYLLVCAAIIVICITMICRARNVMYFAAQSQRCVRSVDCCAVPFKLSFGELCFWGGFVPFSAWYRSSQVSVEVAIFVDGSVLRTD